MSTIVAVVIAGTVAGTLVSGPLTAAPPGHTVVVRVYDTFGASPREVEAALDTARAILHEAAIDLVGRQCGPCDEALIPGELIVRIVAAPAQAEPHSLGCSLVDLRQGGGILATMFVDRIEAMARTAGFDPGVLLGRAMAHELAHLLIGTTEHSTHGLMRARWNVRDLDHPLHRDWVLSRDEGARMRRALVARARRPRLAEIIVATDGSESSRSTPGGFSQ